MATKKKAHKTAAWTRSEGKNSKGGLNEKGRKSYEREHPGSDLKHPVKKKEAATTQNQTSHIIECSSTVPLYKYDPEKAMMVMAAISSHNKISFIGFFKFILSFILLISWQARRESNPQPAVLETAALPIELLACICY